MVRLHVVQRLAAGQVPTQWVASSFTASRQTEALIDEAWRQVNERPGVDLFDGPMCRLESFQYCSESRTLNLQLSPTSYRLFVGTNMAHPELADQPGAGWGALANPLGVSSGLVTADGWILMGQRNGSVAYYPNRIHPFAGAVEQRAVVDVFEDARRELAEETRLEGADLGDLTCLGLVEDCLLRQPELIFVVSTPRTRAQVERQIDAREHEHGVAIAADGGSVREALANDALTPVAFATLLLWGRAMLGELWFEQAIGACAGRLRL